MICIPLMILLSLINNIFLNNIQLLLKLNYFWNCGEEIRSISKLLVKQPFRQPSSRTDECADKYADLGGFGKQQLEMGMRPSRGHHVPCMDAWCPFSWSMYTHGGPSMQNFLSSAWSMHHPLFHPDLEFRRALRSIAELQTQQSHWRLAEEFRSKTFLKEFSLDSLIKSCSSITSNYDIALGLSPRRLQMINFYGPAKPYY